MQIGYKLGKYLSSSGVHALIVLLRFTALNWDLNKIHKSLHCEHTKPTTMRKQLKPHTRPALTPQQPLRPLAASLQGPPINMFSTETNDEFQNSLTQSDKSTNKQVHASQYLRQNTWRGNATRGLELLGLQTRILQMLPVTKKIAHALKTTGNNNKDIQEERSQVRPRQTPQCWRSPNQQPLRPHYWNWAWERPKKKSTNNNDQLATAA